MRIRRSTRVSVPPDVQPRAAVPTYLIMQGGSKRMLYSQRMGAFFFFHGWGFLLQAVARRFNVKAVSVWLLPIRDFFSFYIYLISFLPSRVRWKGRDFMIEADGSMIARRGSE